MASVSLRQLTKIFSPPVAVLTNVSLEVGPGEFVAILGPSGCGKSTILRCLAGLEAPTAGDLLIGDRRVNDLPPGERDVAMVFQNYALYPHFTVRQNLEFPLRTRRVATGERTRRILEVADRLAIGDLLERMPAALSGGQRQRVALGRALVREPAVFLFDEPLSNLDAGLRVQLRTELVALHRALGTTMLYVTHDQVEALTMGERLMVLQHGRVQQVGNPADIYDRPANTFVARFVGAPGMNLLPGTPDAGRNPPAFVAGDLAIPVPCPPGAAELGIRPEHLRLSDPDAGYTNGEVQGVERTGSETVVHVRLSSSPGVAARVPGLAPHRVGDRVGLLLQPERIHWFGADGQRIA